ncbi:protein FAM133 [Biomphalaria pfeifferi]|uniref:Protein FAM133 n=1 Tax=Biomphalaria pfeifferi TaxID=112525 RepID=A0AAD8FHD4_BIOPF|nr:protein FAM133 [Biomphalaria pfeifferi]
MQRERETWSDGNDWRVTRSRSKQNEKFYENFFFNVEMDETNLHVNFSQSVSKVNLYGTGDRLEITMGLPSQRKTSEYKRRNVTFAKRKTTEFQREPPKPRRGMTLLQQMQKRKSTASTSDYPDSKYHKYKGDYQNSSSQSGREDKGGNSGEKSTSRRHSDSKDMRDERDEEKEVTKRKNEREDRDTRKRRRGSSSESDDEARKVHTSRSDDKHERNKYSGEQGDFET